MLWINETKLMAKYGLKIEELEDEDWRDIFDMLPHQAAAIVKKYVAPHKVDKFMSDLYQHNAMNNEVYFLLHQLEDVLGFPKYSGLSEQLMQTIDDIIGNTK